MTNNDQDLKSWYSVGLVGVGLIGLLAIISMISRSSEYGSQYSQPSIAVPLLLMAATALAFLALKFALKIQNPPKPLLFLIVSVGISLRAIGLFTTPILEIDYYRYIWDGKVTAEGVSPYSHSPARILKAELTSEPSYRQVVALSTKSESNFVILQRIHFKDYRTIYPPVSQFIFAAAMKWFAHTASIPAHIISIKAVMVFFDLLTMWLVFLLLKRLDFHQGWLIAYAWNPLMIKEVANGGHLDSIVSFFIMTSVYLVTRWMCLEKSERKTTLPLLSGVALGLGVGAKLFPIVLFPALFFAIARYRWSKAALFSCSFIVTSTLCLWPMYEATSKVEQTVSRATALTEPIEHAPRSPNARDEVSDDGKEGLSSFLTQWRMNDVIFSGLYLNLKPDSPDKADGRGYPWFVISSSEFRNRVNQWCQAIGLKGNQPTFILTRILTMSLFALFYVWQLVRIYRETESGVGINFERLTWIAAAFLFLQPTVNPWYWVWIAPLACLSRNAGWLLVSGFLMTYYCRFWFKTIEGTYQFGGTGYSGEGMFDHGLAWIEFACIVAVLIWFHFSGPSRYLAGGLVAEDVKPFETLRKQNS